MAKEKYPSIYDIGFSSGTQELAISKDEAIDIASDYLHELRPDDFEIEVDEAIPPTKITRYEKYRIIFDIVEYRKDDDVYIFTPEINGTDQMTDVFESVEDAKKAIDKKRVQGINFPKGEFPNPDAITDLLHGWWF